MLSYVARAPWAASSPFVPTVLCSLRHATNNAAAGGAAEHYVYLPPGCSLKEPSYISLSDPVYFTDPKPADREAIASMAKKVDTSSKTPPSSPAQTVQAEGRHPYKMVDDYAQQTYVYSAPRSSMREPRYVSITDPVYMQNSTPENER